jgi:protein disulfide-isomerase A1
LAPEWIKAAKALSDSPIKLAKVDATEATELAKTYEVRGFPTIKYFKNGKAVDYNGGRTESEIVSWVNKKSGPSFVTISSDDDLLKFQEAHEVFTLGVFSSVDSDAAKKFAAFAAEDENHVFALTTNTVIRSKLAITEDTIVVIKSFDDLRNDLVVGLSFDQETVAAFVAGNSTPLIQEFSPESSKKIFGSPITKHVLFFTNKAADHHAPTKAVYSTVASQFKGKTLFVNVPSSETKVLEFFGITEAQVPTMVLADLGAESGIKKFPYTGAVTSEAITAHVQNFLDGKLKPHLKSEPVLPEDTANDVIVLKGESFADLVLNNDKDVLVEFYAPWCGHCKKLAPTWDELATKLKGINEKVVVAKFDGTSNEIDVPGVAVKGFPTIYFFKGNDKSNPVKYEKGREVDDFINFLKENGHNSFAHEEL